jgi:hypothetical protein
MGEVAGGIWQLAEVSLEANPRGGKRVWRP